MTPQVADRYSWEVDEWRERFETTYAQLEKARQEYEFHVGKLERTVAWLTVQLAESKVVATQVSPPTPPVIREKAPPRFYYEPDEAKPSPPTPEAEKK